MKITQKKKLRLITALIIGVLLVLGIAFTVYAGVSDNVLNWWSVDGGGGRSQGGNFTLVGTIGQSDAGAMSGESFTLHGGLWPGGALHEQIDLYLPFVLQ